MKAMPPIRQALNLAGLVRPSEARRVRVAFRVSTRSRDCRDQLGSKGEPSCELRNAFSTDAVKTIGAGFKRALILKRQPLH